MKLSEQYRSPAIHDAEGVQDITRPWTIKTGKRRDR